MVAQGIGFTPATSPGTNTGNFNAPGLVNYIAAKPTETFEAGTDVSYGRFDTIDIAGFVSGPINDTLSYRVAARSIQSSMGDA